MGLRGASGTWDLSLSLGVAVRQSESPRPAVRLTHSSHGLPPPGLVHLLLQIGGRECVRVFSVDAAKREGGASPFIHAARARGTPARGPPSALRTVLREPDRSFQPHRVQETHEEEERERKEEGGRESRGERFDTFALWWPCHGERVRRASPRRR